MERVTIVNRTTKSKGKVKLRFRLRDKGGIDIYYRSNIEVALDVLNRLDADGTKRKGCSLVGDDLLIRIQDVIQTIRMAYRQMIDEGLDMVSANLERTIERIQNPEKPKQKEVVLLESLAEFAEQCHRNGRIADIRYRQYGVLKRQLERYLTISAKKTVHPQQFTAKDIMGFRDFLFNEHQIVSQYSFLYLNIKDRDIPKQRRAETTVSATLKRLKTYFKEMEETDVIIKSPFNRLSRADKRLMLKEEIGEWTGLTQNDIKTIQNQSVPTEFEEVKDAFLLQCYIGCRISDYTSFSMDRVLKDEEGVPYIHYLPKKERKQGKIIDAPLIPSAMKIIDKYKFDFKVLKNISGEKGYNKRIKELLAYCGINRLIDSKDGGRVSICERASSKSARKTYLTLQVEYQSDPYILGVHKQGSKAVENYLHTSMASKYMLVCRMFDEEEEGKNFLEQSA